jgi:hypothetical protein
VFSTSYLLSGKIEEKHIQLFMYQLLVPQQLESGKQHVAVLVNAGPARPGSGYSSKSINAP